MPEMVKRGILKPGSKVLVIPHKGKEHYADLDSRGRIFLGKRIFSTPSSLTNFIKQRQDNGWTSVLYEGKKLSDWCRTDN